MRIFSQLGTDEALDVALEITVPVTNIVQDEALVAELKKVLPSGTRSEAEVMRFGLAKIAALMPILLKAHRADVYAILAPFNGLTAEETGKQNIITTCNQVRKLMQDKDFMDFFASLRSAEAQSE